MSTARKTTTSERIAWTAAALFADRGYDGVSMRDIADAVGIKAASLYNHFEDKEGLYLAAIEQAFADRISRINTATQSDETPPQRLLETLIALMQGSTEDAISSKLLQRELLSSDPNRIEWLTDHLFRKPFEAMTVLLEEIGPPKQGELIALHLCALTMGYSTLAPIFRQLGVPSYLSEPEALGQDIAGRLADFSNGETA